MMTKKKTIQVSRDVSYKRKKESLWSPEVITDHVEEPTAHSTTPPLSDPEEVRHIQRVILAFRRYLNVSLARIDRRRRDFLCLSDELQSWVPTYLQNLEQSKEAIRKNDKLLRYILSTVENFESFQAREQYGGDLTDGDQVVRYTLECYESDIEKVRSILLHIMRDWSKEGAPEREECYRPLIDSTIKEYERFCSDSSSRKDPATFRVLVPGAGLGRLAWELAREGFQVQGNDFTYYSLFSSNYILNYIMEDTHVEGMEFFPFIHQTTNVIDSADILSPVYIPDVDTRELPSFSNFSMVAGDFVEVYGSKQQAEQWDCVVTCFFMDTAHNILDYVSVIKNLLKPGGSWINLGPLLYHYADTEDEPSIELSLQELRRVINMLFDIEFEEMRSCSYTRNPRSMLQLQYRCSYFVAHKKHTTKS
ncbi:Carnosine N-methyltransferase [Galdieria sulphuraria]|uniref:carnosine N-methyltransferase n=1 Tax=Galdieria sulphuraria TaxID=130081 RepID=M2X3J2_GALSU|nr:uncharacterized protein Gasu_17380 [Galdieria sulphuraria]EME30975.1 hypothetical protein Gasu_17380 [Galdieria sulphuraria]GJD10954.1 Carnosine N-methyltransferase [Galdieria sulphuraria]|eukprot:XP_005707495.1 hypothetical protein Gasu_17380 [Galdieria sulphuraria]